MIQQLLQMLGIKAFNAKPPVKKPVNLERIQAAERKRQRKAEKRAHRMAKKRGELG